MSTSEGWDVNRRTARSTSPPFVVWLWQCKLVSYSGLRKRRSALWALRLEENFTFTFTSLLAVTYVIVGENADDRRADEARDCCDHVCDPHQRSYTVTQPRDVIIIITHDVCKMT